VRIQQLWRYPVKSMQGETLDSAELTVRGVMGDRQWAIVDVESNTAVNGRYTQLLFWQPTIGPSLKFSLPDGRQVEGDEALSEALGRKVKLMSQAPEGLLVDFPAGTVGGKYASATALPLSQAAPAGTFFDLAAIHLIATSTIADLQADLRRLRPNIVVDTGDAPAFLENAWAGKRIAIGDDVVLRGLIPCPRCVMTTRPQPGLPHDPEILKTIVKKNRVDLGDFGNLPCAGLYAEVLSGGAIRPGDELRILDDLRVNIHQQ